MAGKFCSTSNWARAMHLCTDFTKIIASVCVCVCVYAYVCVCVCVCERERERERERGSVCVGGCESERESTNDCESVTSAAVSNAHLVELESIHEVKELPVLVLMS